MITIQAIQEKLASYLANGIDLATFEDWIAQNTWNLHRSGDLATQHLGYAVELLLAEYSSLYLSETALRRELSLLLLTPMIRFDQVLLGGSRSSNRSITVSE